MIIDARDRFNANAVNAAGEKILRALATLRPEDALQVAAYALGATIAARSPVEAHGWCVELACELVAGAVEMETVLGQASY